MMLFEIGYPAMICLLVQSRFCKVDSEVMHKAFHSCG